MSQYRDDRDAARQRIAELEARLAEREAALSEQRVSLAEREAEIARLRHQLILSGILGSRARPVTMGGGPPYPPARPVQAAFATRMVVLAVTIAGAALAVGILALRAPRPVVIEVAPSRPPAAAQPILADPAPIAVRHEPAAEEPSGPPPVDEGELRRQLEPKVWAGKASRDEIRMLKAICAHQGDRACRDRAAKLLPRAKPPVF